jgi:hypothetical protein
MYYETVEVVQYFVIILFMLWQLIHLVIIIEFSLQPLWFQI